MCPKGEADVWKHVRRIAIDEFSIDAFKRVAGRVQLRKRLKQWLTDDKVALDDEVDVEDAADIFFAHHRYDFLSDQSRTAPRVAITNIGSLARVAAYAEALPAVMEAREEVLGTREPLTSAEALDWLRRETQGSEERSLVEVRFRFLVPKSAPALWRLHEGLSGPELLSSLDEAAMHKTIAPGADKPAKRPIEWSLILQIDQDDECLEVDLLRGDSEKMDALLRWTRRLASRCVGGAASEDMPDYSEALNAAIWLILAGVWPRVSVDATVYPRRGWSLVRREERSPPQVPYMLIRVEASDTPPDVVRNAYQNLRHTAELSMVGRPPEPESEVLCMAALDVQEIDGIRRGGPGFLDAVIRRYGIKAKSHGVDAAAFPNTPKGRDKAKRALKRAGEKYDEQFPGHALLGGFDSER
jgi:hypothetical protein